MGRYNLLDEKWITVLRKDSGETENVSLLNLFEHAGEYRALAGEMEVQNFAILRVLLAILTTVFTRVDATGEAYEWIELDGSERLIVEEAVDEDDEEDYTEALEDTWKNIWEEHCFPPVVCQYLKAWHERFYLLDDKYPFFQVTKKDLIERFPSGESNAALEAKNFLGKKINRMISESDNKEAIFTPVAGERKSRMTEAELARWLITMHGYVGTADKVKFPKENKEKDSKGWLYDMGGIYMEGDDIFETLWMNTMLYHTEDDVRYTISPQFPSWEDEPIKRLDAILAGKPLTNLAYLYTAWSRAVYIPVDWTMEKDVSVGAVKVTEIDRENGFIEPMTLWNYNTRGEHKNNFMPKPHEPMQALWRSFGLLIPEKGNAKAKRPAIIDYYHSIASFIDNRMVKLHAVGVLYDNKPASRLPIDEISDTLFLNEIILTDDEDNGWSGRVRNIVAETKNIVETVYNRFLKEVAEIRFNARNKKISINEVSIGGQATAEIRLNARNKNIRGFVDNGQARLYEKIDKPFREWLWRIQPDDDKAAKESLWKKELYGIALREAEQLMKHLTPRDYKGEENCITAYQAFKRELYKKLLPDGN